MDNNQNVNYQQVPPMNQQPVYQAPPMNQQPVNQVPPMNQQPMYQAPPMNQQPMYQAPPMSQQPVYQNAPVMNSAPLKTDRSFAKFFWLSLITLNIYGLVCWGGMANDLEYIAYRNDGKKQMNFYLVALLLGPLTGGIVSLIWYHNFSERLGNEIVRRGINYKYSASDFWLWNVLGSLIIVGPFIYIAKTIKAMNYICQDFNTRGF